VALQKERHEATSSLIYQHNTAPSVSIRYG